MPKYTNNFLDKVTLKLDFEDVSFANLSEYTSQVGEVFDIRSAKSGFEGSLNIDFSQGKVEQSRQDLSIYEYSSTTMPNKKITFSQKWISLEYEAKSYKDSAELIADLEAYIQPFVERLGVRLINRIGLRYINQVKAPTNANPLDWSEFINSDLVGALTYAHSKNDSTLSRSFTQQYFKTANADILFSFGMWNEDFPNPIVEKVFILDIDCFSNTPREVRDITLRTEVKEFNNIVEGYFESSIEQPLRELMGVEE